MIKSHLRVATFLISRPPCRSMYIEIMVKQYLYHVGSGKHSITNNAIIRRVRLLSYIILMYLDSRSPLLCCSSLPVIYMLCVFYGSSCLIIFCPWILKCTVHIMSQLFAEVFSFLLCCVVYFFPSFLMF